MVRRGRQAEAARNDRLVLDAAREVFTSQGFDAPVSAVAERAGVGIGSLYRRYGSKTELLQRLCVLAMEQVAESAEDGLRADDPWAGLAGHIERCVGFGSGQLAPVAGMLEATDEMWAVNRRVGRLVDRLVKRAKDTAALRADVTSLDITVLIENLGRRRPVPEATEDLNNRARVVAIALDGLRTPAPNPLPGHPPRRSHYEGPWQK